MYREAFRKTHRERLNFGFADDSDAIRKSRSTNRHVGTNNSVSARALAIWHSSRCIPRETLLPLRPRALFNKPLGGREADAAGAAGDDGDLVFQLRHVVSFSVRKGGYWRRGSVAFFAWRARPAVEHQVGRFLCLFEERFARHA